MQETATAFHNLESPAPGAAVSVGRQVVRGWLVAKPGAHFVDVRARSGLSEHRGVHGFSRPDLADFFKLGPRAALAEFRVPVDFHPGANEIVLEALHLDGRWESFATYRFQAAAHGAAENSAPAVPLPWHVFTRLLGLLFREKRRRADAALDTIARELIATLPLPNALWQPHAPFRGYLDDPAALAPCIFGRTPVVGYLFHESAPIKRVLATVDLHAWQTLNHLNPAARPDGGDSAGALHARRGGVEGVVAIPSQLPSPACVRVYAELHDGSLHLCFAQHSRTYTHEDEKAPYTPVALATFEAARDALQTALAERGLTVVDDADLRRGLAQLEADHRLRAPAAVPPFVPLKESPRTSTAPLPRRMLLVSHNLNVEGAPLFLLDYARYLAGAGVEVTVLSASEGPLRKPLEEFGARVWAIDVRPVFSAQSARAAREAIAEIARQFDFGGFDLVMTNTFTTFWAVHAAKLARRKVLFYVHESTTPASFYQGGVHPDVIGVANDAFAAADRVSFTSEFTRNYHLDYGNPASHRLTPGWIDVARIDQWAAGQSRETLRSQRFALKPGESLIVNVGTICPRKGQHVFACAVDLLWRRYPELASRARFIALGGADTLFDVQLADLLSYVGRPNLEVHPTTTDHFPYYLAADLFVCSTYEESSPRVILEAMACRTPILSSDISAVREQTRPDREAVLIPAGDTVRLCEAMANLLRAPELRAQLAARARERVENEFAASRLLPRHAALASELAASPP
jgi:glycosyltransferase involved in cell wall biosynthesis